jgi:hypothetical protein
MKKFFFSHPDIILASIAFVLLAVLIGFFSWGINDVVYEIQQSTGPGASMGQQGFNLMGAAQLNLHGASTSSVPATSTSIIVMTSTVATTTASSSTSISSPSPLKP